MIRPAAVFAILVLGAAIDLQAQMPAAGRRIRVIEQGTVTRTGTLVRVTDDSVAITIGQAQPEWVVLNRNSRLEVMTGLRRNTLRGLGAGAGVGIVGGAVLGLVTYQKPDCSQSWICMDFGPGLSAVAGAAVGGLAGMLVGTVIGSFSKSEAWARVNRPAVRPAIVTSRSGAVVVGATLSF